MNVIFQNIDNGNLRIGSSFSVINAGTNCWVNTSIESTNTMDLISNAYAVGAGGSIKIAILGLSSTNKPTIKVKTANSEKTYLLHRINFNTNDLLVGAFIFFINTVSRGNNNASNSEIVIGNDIYNSNEIVSIIIDSVGQSIINNKPIYCIIQNIGDNGILDIKDSLSGNLIASHNANDIFQFDFVNYQNTHSAYSEIYFCFKTSDNTHLINRPYLTITLNNESVNVPAYESENENYDYYCYFQFVPDTPDNLVYIYGNGLLNYSTITKNINSILIDVNNDVTPAISDNVFRVYKMTNNSLALLARNSKIIKESEYYYETIELQKFVQSLVEYPFNLTGLVQSALILGNNVTQINTERTNITEYTFTIESEQVINGIYRDKRDIQSEIIANIPFCDKVVIDSKYINSNIKFVYICDIKNNNAIVKIFSNDNLINVLTCQIGLSLPYVINEYTDKSISSRLQLKNDNVYIEVYQSENQNEYVDTVKNDVLNNFSGFIRIEKINTIANTIPKDFLNRIETLLKNGVYL